MTAVSPETVQALAEALSEPAKELAAGLLRRPLPDPTARPVPADDLARGLAGLRAEALPALREALEDLSTVADDDVEESVEELLEPLFALLESARDLHRAALTPEAEPLRPFLAAIAEDPLTDTLEIFLHIIQAALNPWGLFEDPEHPDLDLALKPDAPAHLEALRALCAERPGLLSRESLDRLGTTVGG